VKLSLVVCSIIVAAIVGCASSSKETPGADSAATSCVPRQTFRCTCGLLEGTQSCTDDRELTPCVCGKQSNNSTPRPRPTVTTETNPTEPPHPPGPVCGDGKVDPGEACDDGNLVDGDGCSSKCRPDGAPAAAGTCPGQPMTLWQASTVVLAGTTDGFADDLQTSCYPSTGPDRVYSVTPSADGFMQIDAVFAADFNAIVEVREGTCESPDAHILCEDTFSRPFQRIVQVKAGKPYFVIIDGDTPSAHGAYTIKLDLP
jgi:cysteine-rich repeat protein